VVGKQRSGRWIGASLTNAHAHACEKQSGKTAGAAAKGRHQAPQTHCGSDDVAAAEAIRQPCNRQAQAAVEQCKGQAAEQGQLGVGKVELTSDGFKQYGEDLQVHEAEYGNQPEQDQYVVTVTEHRTSSLKFPKWSH